MKSKLSGFVKNVGNAVSSAADAATAAADTSFTVVKNSARKAGLWTGCNKEIMSKEGDPLAPQNHHQRTFPQGEIRWKLNVRTNTGGE